MAALRQCQSPCNFYKKFCSVNLLNVTRSCVTNQHLKTATDLVVDDDEAHYPPVKPKLPPGSWGQMDRRFVWAEYRNSQEISRLKTVQDKLYFLARHKFMTWKYDPVSKIPRLFDYQCDKTKTHPVLEPRTATDIKHSRLPDVYKEIKLDADVLKGCETLIKKYSDTFDYINRTKVTKRLDKLKPLVNSKHVPNIDEASAHLRSKELMMSLISYLSGHYDHISQSNVDENVRVAATWDRHGVARYLNRLETDKTGMFFKKRPADFKLEDFSAFYAEHIVNLQVRKNKPLQQFIPLDDPLNDSIAYPLSPFRPSVLGQFQEVIRRGCDTGSAIEDPCSFTHLNVVLLTERVLMRMLREYGQDTYDECLTGYALSTGFLSAVAQAHYQGFNKYEELTYPITTQTIITDGHRFMFSAYQLNTLQLWKDDIAVPHHNVCWISRPQPLWTRQKETDQGFGETVIDRKTFETLLKFLVMPSAEIENPRPNLDEPQMEISKAHIPAEEGEYVAIAKEFQRAKLLENKFKVLRPYEYEEYFNLKDKK